MQDPLWLIGTGGMAEAYAKVLTALAQDFRVIGNTPEGCRRFHSASGIEARPGGIPTALAAGPAPLRAIVAAPIESLSSCCQQLLQAGVTTILLEKPGVGYAQELPALAELARQRGANVLLAYNRRFYASTRRAQEQIAAEGGVRSFYFEFTEWSHQIGKLQKHRAEWENWFLGNSSHVVDLAFFLGGHPAEINSLHSGSLDWHSRSSVFAGSGRTESGALFSYLADWAAPGRWGLELSTAAGRYIFRPVEKLARMEIGSVAITPVEIDDSLDLAYKPGVYLQTQAFLASHWQDFVSLDEQLNRMDLFCRMAGYEYP